MSLERSARGAARFAAAKLAGRLDRSNAFAQWPKAEALGPVETIDVHPALFEPDQLDRVLACGFASTLESEVKKLTARRIRTSPPVRYCFEDAYCLGGQIFSAGGRHYLSNRKPLRALCNPIVEFDDAIAVNSGPGLNYFGHWLRDDCAAFLLGERNGTPLSLQRPAWVDRDDYERMLGQRWTDQPAFHARRLSLIQDIGYSADKADRLRTLRRRLRDSTTGSGGGGIVYVRRGVSGHPRTMSNEAELISVLEAEGARIVEAETGTVALVRACLDAEVIISIEGSQLAHAVYCLRDGGAVLALQPPERFYNPHHEWARLLGMQYGLVVGQKNADGYRVDPGEVLAMLARIR